MSDTIQLKSEYEGAEVFSSDPLVAVRNNVISPIECAYLIELAKPHIKRAGVVLDELRLMFYGNPRRIFR